MRKVLLTVVHYVLFVPIASVVRLFRDPLDRAWDAERASYWTFTSGDMRAAPAQVPASATARVEGADEAGAVTEAVLAGQRDRPAGAPSETDAEQVA